MQKIDKQPEGTVHIGLEKPPGDSAEAGGRGGKYIVYTCINDGAGNYIDTSWDSWTCWRCGTTFGGLK
jgi:hypothetical protein